MKHNLNQLKELYNNLDNQVFDKEEELYSFKKNLEEMQRHIKTLTTDLIRTKDSRNEVATELIKLGEEGVYIIE